MIRSTKIIQHFATAMVSSAPADDAPDYRYPTTFNNVTSKDNNPGHTPAPLLSDEEFYGKWDGTAWTTAGLFDYAAHPGMRPVEAAVKRGNYEAAGKALLAYFRIRNEIDVQDLPEVDEHNRLLVELFMDQLYMHPALAPHYQFEVRPEARSFVFDVTEDVRSGTGRFLLSPRNKGDGAALFNSRKAARQPPHLRLTMNGTLLTLMPVADTYLQFGAGAKGDESVLVVRGSRPGEAVDGQTCRALLSFGLNEIDIKDVEKAELVLNGKTQDRRGTVQVLLGPDKDSPLEPSNEKTLSWAHVNHRYFSYQGLEGLKAWRNPEQGSPHTWFFITAIVRFPHYPHLIAAYVKTGDERYARRAVQIYLDYVEYQMFNRLDSGFRVRTLIRPSAALYKSPSMTPQALKIMLEHAWRLGNWYQHQRQWNQNNNYGSSYIVGAGSLAYQFPEFRDTSKWWVRTHERALSYTSRGMFFADHSFKEANTGYGPMVLDSLNHYRKEALGSGFHLPEELACNFCGIARYAMDVSDPAGLIYPYGDTYTPRQYDKKMIRDIAVDHNDPELLFITTDGREGQRPERTSVWYPDSRLGIMRTAWVDENALGLFVNARNGGRHWHPNTLSLCAYGYGRQLIDDTYYASSDPSDPRSKWTRQNTRAHNTIEINGKPQRESGAADGGMIVNDQFDLFAGYTEASEGFLHRRRILLVKPSAFWIVSDWLEARSAPEATHRYTQAWHPRPNSRVSIQGVQKVAATAYPSNGNINIVPADPEKLTAGLADGWWVEDTNTYVIYEKSTEGSTTFDTVLYPMFEGDHADVTLTRLDIGVPATSATALEIGIVDTRGTRTGWYYLSYEEEPATRILGHLTTDAGMVYLEQDHKGPRTLSLERAGILRDGKELLFESDSPVADLGVEWDAGRKAIRISSTSPTAANGLKIVAPFDTDSVTWNGTVVGFTQHANAVILQFHE